MSVAHIIETNDIAIALRRSIGAAEGMSFLCWLDDDQLGRLKELTRFHSFVPDGFSLVQVNTGSGMKIVPLFVEVDRQTETVKSTGLGGRDWFSKIQRYSNYLSLDFLSDPLLQFVGVGEEYLHLLDAPRVLTITKSPARVEKMVEVTREVGGKATYLYTTKDQALAEVGSVLQNIWRTTTLDEPDMLSLEAVLRRPLN